MAPGAAHVAGLYSDPQPQIGGLAEKMERVESKS